MKTVSIYFVLVIAYDSSFDIILFRICVKGFYSNNIKQFTSHRQKHVIKIINITN